LGFYHEQATIARGWALVDQGLPGEGIEQMRQGLAVRQAAGADLTRPHFLALLAQALGNNGQVEEGLALLQEALAAAERTGERCYDAEILRIKGEILLMQSNRGASPAAQSTNAVVKAESAALADAGDCFYQSIKIAQRQNAKSLELRAAMSLARLCRSQGKQREAWHQLAQIYSSFTEGFQTADLREAKALLDELSQASLA